MKVGFYSPYLSTGVIGGGEKHVLEVARTMAQKHEVTIGLSSSSDKDFNTFQAALQQRLTKFLGWQPSIFKFAPTPLGTNANIFTKLFWTSSFDYLYAVTDGSLFFSFAKRNNLHIQVPFTNAQAGVMNRLKLANWQIKNANSQFTQHVVEQHWHTAIPFVHYPLVRTDEFSPNKKKQNYILSVGRFFRQLHSKRQDILIAAFAKLRATYPRQFADWKLILIGPNEDAQYVQELHASAKNLPVEFLHSIGRKELVTWYERSRIYWHAAGYEQDVKLHPESVEHFGISIVEAMAAGAVPLAVGSGGPAEILSGTLSTLQWQSISECVNKTADLCHSAVEESQLRQQCAQRALDFSQTEFERTVWNMMN